MQAARKPWLAPAKINLFLHITGQRQDGYHDLQTIFQFLDYSDVLYFLPRADDKIVLQTQFKGIEPEDNLIVRAAKKIQAFLAPAVGVSIVIDKNIPMGGGLGGGSSDAATTLVALNEIWQSGLSLDELAQIGLTLGADVPVFVHGHCAWAQGVGEDLTPVELPEQWYLVISPGVEVSTAEIFSDPQLTRNCAAITIRDFLEGHLVKNVCEEIVIEKYPEVAKALEFLDTTGSESRSMVTGTGGCVFAPYRNKKQAEKALSILPSVWRGFVAKTCNQSPLYADK